jgi:hypothetical protein
VSEVPFSIPAEAPYQSMITSWMPREVISVT